jgi:type IV pilus biogenesis protein CpaD/CtpE
MRNAIKLTSLILAGVIVSGCEKQNKSVGTHSSEIVQIEAEEIKEVGFFECTPSFDIDIPLIEGIDAFLQEARAKGEENVAFMLVSDQIVPPDVQKELRRVIYHLMYRNGFMKSRIIDSGNCIYDNAKNGIRIDMLHYEVKVPDCDIWSEYIGDFDSYKHLPHHGAAEAYNLSEMIANKADFISPRSYQGQSTKAAIAAAAAGIGGTGTGGGGGTSSGSGKN